MSNLGKDSQDQEINISEDKLKGVNALVGVSGSGKSTLVKKLFKQDVENGKSAFYIDYYGDFIRSLQEDPSLSSKIKFISLGMDDSSYSLGSSKSSVEKLQRFDDFIIDFVFNGTINISFKEISEELSNSELSDLERYYKILTNYSARLTSSLNDNLSSLSLAQFTKDKIAMNLRIAQDLMFSMEALNRVITPNLLDIFSKKEITLNLIDLLSSNQSVVLYIPQSKLNTDQIYFLTRMIVMDLIDLLDAQNLDLNKISFYFEELEKMMSFDFMSLISQLKERGGRSFVSLQTLDLNYREAILSPKGRVTKGLLELFNNFFIFNSSEGDIELLSNNLNTGKESLKVGESLKYKLFLDRKESDFGLIDIS